MSVAMFFSADPGEGGVSGLRHRLFPGHGHVPFPGGLDHDLAFLAHGGQ